MGNLIRGGTDKSYKDYQHSTHNAGSEVVLVVTEDYPHANISKPFFRMGEKLSVLSQEASWWRVRSVQTRHENYIPNSHVAKVYHGWLFEGVTRQKAEALLQLPVNRPGSFMVRESNTERGMYLLSVKHSRIQHYRISRLDNRWYYISPRLTFQCLEDMINHYSDCADGLCCVLSSPCLCDTSPEDPPQAQPVVMRRHFKRKDVDSPSFLDGGDTRMSYGVRNSIAAYLSLSGPFNQKRESRTKKSRSLYARNSDSRDYVETF